MSALRTYASAMVNLTYVRIDKASALSHWNMLAEGMVTHAHFFAVNDVAMVTQKCVAGMHGHRSNRRRMMIHKFRERQVMTRLNRP